MDHQTSGLHSHSSQSGFQWLSFAYQGLTEIPYDTILPQTGTLQVLDLSYNQLEEYPFHQGWPAPASQTGSGMKAGFCEAASSELLASASSFLHSFLTGTRLCWASCTSSARWSWTGTITHPTSSSPTCPA